MGTLKPETFTMCHQKKPSHMAFVPQVGQVQPSALTRWIDMKARKTFRCLSLSFAMLYSTTPLLRHQQESVSSPARR